jgi:hypothetical protein
MEKVYSLVERYFYALPANNDFERGFFAAMLLTAAIFLLLLLLCLILKIIFRKPAVPGVTLPREDGDIFISRNAVYTAVCQLEKDFPEFEILKVSMRRDLHNDLALTVTLLYEEQQRSFDAAAAGLKQSIFSMLNRSFGIESVKSVSIVLARIPGRSADDNDNSVSVSGNAFISGV